MNSVNSITLRLYPEQRGYHDESKEDYTNFKNQIGELAVILLKNNYDFAVKYDDCGFVHVEFDYAYASDLRNSILTWVDEDEIECNNADKELEKQFDMCRDTL